MAKYSSWLIGVLALSSVAVHAMGGGQDASTVPVVNPETGQSTDIWRLAGYFPAFGVSGVQIAPGWIMVAKHATPPNGAYFGNGFGVARIEGCYTYPNSDGVDLRVCKLQKNVNVPSGFVFPALVEHPDSLANGRRFETLVRDMGQFLSVGYGQPNLGVPMFAWSDFMSMPLENASPDIMGMGGAAPYVDFGDSGSPTFWFSSKTGGVGLIGLRSTAGPVGPHGTFMGGALTGNIAPFSMPILNWVASTVTGASQDTVQVLSALNFHGAIKPTPSWVGKGGVGFHSSTPTSVNLKWSAPQYHASDVQKYLVFVLQGNQTVRSGFVGAAVNQFSVVGLSMGVDYLACVTPIGVGGFAPFGAAQKYGANNSDVAWDLSYSCSKFSLNPAPSSVPNLAVEMVRRDFGAAGVWPSEKVTWSRPASPAMPSKVYYRVGVSVNGALPTYTTVNEGTVKMGPARTVKGDRICVTVTPYSEPATAGVATEAKCVTVE